MATRVLFVAVLFAAPLAFGAVQPWAWGTLAVLAFLLFFLWAIGTVQQGAIRIAWTPLYLPAAAFFLLGMVQYFGHFTLDPIATREALVKLATVLVLFFLAAQLLASAGGRTLRFFGSSVAVYVVLMSLFAILQFFSSQGLIFWTVKAPGWNFGPYVNHNHYAGLMEMLIPIAVASVLPKLRWHAPAFLLGFMLLIPIASVLLSGSRGGSISLLVELVLAVVLLFLYGPGGVRRAAVLWGCAAILAGGMFLLWMAPPQSLEHLETIADLSHSPEVTLGSRLVASRDSLRIFRAYPLLGTGLGSFETVFARYQTFPSDLAWDHAHNDFAEALAETGAVGGILILSALGYFFAKAFSRRRSALSPTSRVPSPGSRVPSTRHLAPGTLLRLGAALGCCGLLVHSFVDFNLHILANAAWFAVCAALSTCDVLRAPTAWDLPWGAVRNRG